MNRKAKTNAICIILCILMIVIPFGTMAESAMNHNTIVPKMIQKANELGRYLSFNFSALPFGTDGSYKIYMNSQYWGAAYLSFNHMGRNGTADDIGICNHLSLIVTYQDFESVLTPWLILSDGLIRSVTGVNQNFGTQISEYGVDKVFTDSGYSFSVGSYDCNVKHGFITRDMGMLGLQIQVRNLY